MALLFSRIDIFYMDEDTGLLDVTKSRIDGRSERHHGGRKAHVCVDQRRDGFIVVPDGLDQDLVIIFKGSGGKNCRQEIFISSK